jgi:hypothetical protein
MQEVPQEPKVPIIGSGRVMKAALVILLGNLRKVSYKTFMRNAPYYPVSQVGYNRGISYTPYMIPRLSKHKDIPARLDTF